MLLLLVQTLTNMRDLKRAATFTYYDQKGRGYAPAEQDPISWHAVPKFDPKTGTLPKSPNARPTFSKILGTGYVKKPPLMKVNGNHPAMREGSGMVRFSKEYPAQYFDVAIAEQHAVTFAAGLAIGGYKPIVAIYSTFLQRAYDQVIHDVAIQNSRYSLLSIVAALLVRMVRPTKELLISLFLRCIPNMIIMAPSDENECRQNVAHRLPLSRRACRCTRYPRGSGVGAPLQPLSELPIGKGIIRRQGKSIAVILNFGTLLPEALDVAEKLDATVADMRFLSNH